MARSLRGERQRGGHRVYTAASGGHEWWRECGSRPQGRSQSGNCTSSGSQDINERMDSTRVRWAKAQVLQGVERDAEVFLVLVCQRRRPSGASPWAYDPALKGQVVGSGPSHSESDMSNTLQSTPRRKKKLMAKLTPTPSQDGQRCCHRPSPTQEHPRATVQLTQVN